ncbi:MAG: hypothetical protein L6Q34_07640 [Nitrospira sp.]|nr:hypothetical protein [Nitrospira sp. NTP2]MCK6493289.1 hypothetical protein [Nitrospira sp.]RIK58484.1 MAG: hypothetical protein DCC63_10910 [Nitrospira sp.]
MRQAPTPDCRVWRLILTMFGLWLGISGCTHLGPWPQASSSEPSADSQQPPLIPNLAAQIETDLRDNLPARLPALRTSLSNQSNKVAKFKRGAVTRILADPWAGLSEVEGAALLAVAAAESGVEGLPALVDILENEMGRTGTPFTPRTFPATMARDELLGFLTTVLEEAHHDREEALRRLSPQEREFLFSQARTLVEGFIPQITPPDQLSDVEVAGKFAALLMQQVDYAALITAAQRLARFGNRKFLRQLEIAFQNRKPISHAPPGVTGEILLAEQTAYGWLIVGGRGPNSYDLDQGAALIIDLGGNDSYRGVIGASANSDIGNGVVIDLAGNDLYEPLSLGFATGRLGVGLVIDQSGDDTYRLAPGTGGVGLAGLGLLYDGEGHDVYEGSRFTQGASFGGFGLLVDRAGDDHYQSFGYALGFGGPLGVGALIDVAGNDSYDCGGRYPSAYNATDAPNAQPQDPAFQYDCFGLGTGAGLRLFSKNQAHRAQSLAGGWGLLIDADGNDRYRSANFSQGHGYFFGLGVKLDLAGDDEHQAARYGQGTAAHFGVGLTVDYQGKDRYRSKGPYYNGGSAWDGSVALAVDGGHDSDFYDLPASSGLGMADLGGWGLFIEQGGADQYAVSRGLGYGADTSVGAFFDLEGRDDYSSVPPPADGLHPERLNHKTYLENMGSLFVDR